MDGMQFKDEAKATVTRNRILRDIFNPKGMFHIECYDKHGVLKWKDKAKNGVTDEGLNKILQVFFSDTVQTNKIVAANWAIGLVDNAGFSAYAAGDTHASHAGWTEFTSYSNATRVAWGPGAAASKQVTNSVTADFNINGSGTVRGLFVAGSTTIGNANTKGGASAAATLWSTADFSGGNQAVVSGDVLKITYTIQAA